MSGPSARGLLDTTLRDVYYTGNVADRTPAVGWVDGAGHGQGTLCARSDVITGRIEKLPTDRSERSVISFSISVIIFPFSKPQ